MKKFIIFMALVFSLSAKAQLEVLSNGQIVAGTPFGGCDAKASLSVWPLSGLPSTFTPYISFGSGTNASIGGNSYSGFLNFSAKSGFLFTIENKTAFEFQQQRKTFTFHYNVNAPSFLSSSDARLKKNVEASGDLYLGLKDVNSITYNIVAPSYSDSIGAVGKVSKANEGLLDERVRFGFIAQEIQKIYPNLVVADEDGMLNRLHRLYPSSCRRIQQSLR